MSKRLKNTSIDPNDSSNVFGLNKKDLEIACDGIEGRIEACRRVLIEMSDDDPDASAIKREISVLRRVVSVLRPE